MPGASAARTPPRGAAGTPRAGWTVRGPRPRVRAAQQRRLRPACAASRALALAGLAVLALAGLAVLAGPAAAAPAGPPVGPTTVVALGDRKSVV